MARFIKEMVQTQLDMGLFVALDATAGGHLWRLPELNALVRHPKLKHKKYSWCHLGAKDPVTQRPWHRIRRVLTNMELDALCRGWQEDVFRLQCCDEVHLRQPTRRRLRQNEDLDRNKASREYPNVVVAAIVTDIVALCGQGNEKYDQSFDTKTGAGYGISTVREGGPCASELGRDVSLPGLSAVQTENSQTLRVFYTDDKAPSRTTSGTSNSKSKAEAKKKTKPKATLPDEYPGDCPS